MLYCPNCNLLTEDRQCPICDSHALRQPNAGDFCYLAEESLLWAPALEDLFRDNGIPFVTHPTVSAAITARLGASMDRKRFYVPYSHYTQAKLLTDEFFAADPIFEE